MHCIGNSWCDAVRVLPGANFRLSLGTGAAHNFTQYIDVYCLFVSILPAQHGIPGYENRIKSPFHRAPWLSLSFVVFTTTHTSAGWIGELMLPKTPKMLSKNQTYMAHIWHLHLSSACSGSYINFIHKIKGGCPNAHLSERATMGRVLILDTPDRFTRTHALPRQALNRPASVLYGFWASRIPIFPG